MMFSIHTALLCLGMLATGCVTRTKPSDHNSVTAPGPDTPGPFARYEMAAADLPTFEKKAFQQFSHRTSLIDGPKLRLELVIGSRWSEPPHFHRTESRYRVLDQRWGVVASAESTLADSELDSDSTGHIEILSDPGQEAFFIAEEQSWATQRYIWMAPVHDPRTADLPIAPAWSVAYLRIPERIAPSPRPFDIQGHRTAQQPSDPPHFLGLRDGHLYLEQDGRLYRIPIGAFERVSKLGYTIG